MDNEINSHEPLTLSTEPSRAEIAMRIHAGFMANPNTRHLLDRIYGDLGECSVERFGEHCAKFAVIQTDCLLAELKRTKSNVAEADAKA